MNKGIVCYLENIKEHPNADKLNLANASGFQVIVSKDADANTLGIFFNSNLCLSEEFCKANNLYPIYEIDENGNKIKVGGGFFSEKHSRVKVQNFRGEPSYGFWCELSYLDYLNLETLPKEGDEIDVINNHLICTKYINPHQLKKKNNNHFVSSINKNFPRWRDTEQLKYAINKKSDKYFQGNIIITEKLHGTSGRFGFIKKNKPIKWYHRFLSFCNLQVGGVDWEFLNGTRKTILEDQGKQFYTDNSFRTNISEQVRPFMREGEIIYGEYVGKTNNGQEIQPTSSVEKLKPFVDKKSYKKYFNKFNTTGIAYNYGFNKTQFFVYAIKQTLPNGDIIELSWEQVKIRCKELGLEHVPEVWKQVVVDAVSEAYEFETVLEVLNDLEKWDAENPEDTIKEGWVVRIENEYGINYYKHKTFLFYALEGVIKEEIGDIEDAI